MTWKPNPWIATLLSLVPTPLGMLYVRRPRLAALYLLAYGSVAAMFIVFGSGLGSASFGAARASEGLFSLVCAVHTFTIARRFEPIETRPWYTRWYGG